MFTWWLQELDEADSVWHVQRRAVRSFDDEFGSTLDSDLQLLQVAIIAIIVFTYAAISVWQDGCVGSRSLLTIGGTAHHATLHLVTSHEMSVTGCMSCFRFVAIRSSHGRECTGWCSMIVWALWTEMTSIAYLRSSDHARLTGFLLCAGILNIGLAVLSSYGFASYIGLLFTPLMSILPFIMLGVGVDGMFVLQSALDATDPEESMPERMAVAMRTGGLSVAVASLTNFGAFMIGSNTSLPALSAFSIYAALGLLFNLFLQV